MTNIKRNKKKARKVLQRERALRLQRERDILAMVVHDILTPLTTVTYHIGLLLLQQEDPKYRHSLEVAKRNCEKIKKIIEDGRDTLAFEKGMVKLKEEQIPLRPFLVDIISDLVPEDQERVRYETIDGVHDEDLLRVIGDRIQMERVIQNILGNALKFSDKHVRVEIRRTEEEAVISVIDEGPGINSEDLPHIFEPFYRGKERIGKKGSGLGLYICKLIILAHGGRIWAESKLGQGSTFHIALPCCV